MAGASSSAAERQFVVFNLASEVYGLDITDVREIIPYQPPAAVPSAPAAVSGIINLRGSVVGVINLRHVLGLPPGAVTDDTRIVVVDRDGDSVGMVVDSVTEVVRTRADQIEAAPTLVTASGSSFVRSIVQVDGRLMIALDLEATLAPEALEAAPDGRVIRAEAFVPVMPSRPGLADLDVELLEQTFALLKPRGQEIVDFFYDRLFELHPAVIPLFARADMHDQRGKLLAAIALVVANLRRPDALVPALQELGVRHIAYGAQPAHYDAVGGVLLEALAHVAGDAWTPAIEAAWGAAYAVAADVMVEAATHAAQPEVRAA